MCNWLDELKIKCAKRTINLTMVVAWIQEGQNERSKWEDVDCLGRCYDPRFNALGTRILKGREKVWGGEFRRQMEGVRNAWLRKRPVEMITGHLVAKKVLLRNQVSARDWHLVDYKKIKYVELKNDNLSKFVEERHHCLCNISC